MDFPIIGPQSYSERAVMGVPLLFVGYLLCYSLAWCVIRKGKDMIHPEVPVGTELSRRFFQVAFWTMMGMQVIVMAWSLVPLFDVEFRGDGGKLEGLEIFHFKSGRWRVFGEHQNDVEHPSVWPGTTPVVYFALVLVAAVTCVLLPFKKIKNRQLTK